MRVTYDSDVDILMVRLGDVKARRVETRRLDFGGAIIDLAADGTILAVEILDASRRYTPDELDAPSPDYRKPLTLAEAAKVAGASTEALKKAIQRKRLGGRLIGKNWTTTVEELTEYLNSRAVSGRRTKIAV
jgi:uncharacterized protein YuzE